MVDSDGNERDDAVAAVAAYYQLDDAARAQLDEMLMLQDQLTAAQSSVDDMVLRRKELVDELVGRHVSKYRLAKLLGVSQTTLGNITRVRRGQSRPRN